MHTQQIASAENNDRLEWLQVNDTIKILTLSIAQISLTLGVGDKSVDEVGCAFETLLSDIENIGRKSGTNKTSADNNAEIKHLCDAAAEQARNFIFAFQFYDELSQRLNHISHGLSALSDLIQDEGRFNLTESWHDLQEKIKGKYTIHDENELFDSVMSGMGIENAIQQLLKGRLSEKDMDNEVELF